MYFSAYLQAQRLLCVQLECAAQLCTQPALQTLSATQEGRDVFWHQPLSKSWLHVLSGHRFLSYEGVLRSGRSQKRQVAH